MKNLFEKRKVSVLFLILFACTFIPACGTISLDALLYDSYQDAILQAKDAEASDVSRELLSITADNPLLEWEGEAGKSRVKVVTWTKWEGYKNLVGQGKFLAARDMWVVVPNEAKEFIAKRKYLNDNAMTLRLEEVYGLPPHYGLLYFVEVWVDPQAMFRPSPDPEITDHEAEIDFPESNIYVSVDPGYIEWFENQKATKYGQDGYPWTRLGYTYDWCPIALDDIGFSEFVIPAGSEVEVSAITDTNKYGR
jgi:hypothetical protein